MNIKTNKIVTHNGTFHTDEVFGCAILSLYFEQKKEFFLFLRTRDESIVKSSDIVLDTGGIYDAKNHRYDHHQKGGAGKRDNSLPYASCGLIWKHFGQALCEDEGEVFDIIDKKICTPIDAIDNGVNITTPIYESIYSYDINSIINSMNPTWAEEKIIQNIEDEYFNQALDIAKLVIKRELRNAKDFIEAKKDITSKYNLAEDKRCIILDKNFQRYMYQNVLSSFKEPIFVIYPKKNKGYSIECIRKDSSTFGNRMDFPKSWAGLKNSDLENASGIEGLEFCHNGLFFITTKTKEAALQISNFMLK